MGNIGKSEKYGGFSTFPIVVNRLPLPECRWPQPEDTTWFHRGNRKISWICLKLYGTSKVDIMVYQFPHILYRSLLYLECVFLKSI